jgi:hypothetical protein
MEPVTFSLAADGRGREEALRARFGRFWSTAKGDPFVRSCLARAIHSLGRVWLCCSSRSGASGLRARRIRLRARPLAPRTRPPTTRSHSWSPLRLRSDRQTRSPLSASRVASSSAFVLSACALLLERRRSQTLASNRQPEIPSLQEEG